MSFARPDSLECPIQLCAETCWSEKRLTSRKSQACLWFLAKREDDAFDDERLKVFVCAGLFDEAIPFCVSFDGSELINTSSISGIHDCPFVHVDTRHV